MGTFKLTLPWGDRTVIGQVVSTLTAAGVADIIVVTGHRASEVGLALAATPARCVLNASYETGGMFSSVLAGIHALPALAPAALLCLGDQPQMLPAIVADVLATGLASSFERIVVPSYNHRAGHPVLIPRAVCHAATGSPGPLRDLLRSHADLTDYLIVDSPSVLADLDTQDDYRSRPASHLGPEPAT